MNISTTQYSIYSLVVLAIACLVAVGPAYAQNAQPGPVSYPKIILQGEDDASTPGDERIERIDIDVLFTNAEGGRFELTHAEIASGTAVAVKHTRTTLTLTAEAQGIATVVAYARDLTNDVEVSHTLLVQVVVPSSPPEFKSIKLDSTVVTNREFTIVASVSDNSGFDKDIDTIRLFWGYEKDKLQLFGPAKGLPLSDKDEAVDVSFTFPPGALNQSGRVYFELEVVDTRISKPDDVTINSTGKPFNEIPNVSFEEYFTFREYQSNADTVGTIKAVEWPTSDHPEHFCGDGTCPNSFVVEINEPPRVDNPIPDTTRSPVEPPLIIDLTPVFSDSNEDSLAYSAFNLNPGVAEAFVENDTLIVNMLTDDSTTVAVTATDPDGEQVTDSFRINEVLAGCQIAKSLPDAIVPPNLEIDLTSFFVDCENAEFTATSSDDTKAVATVRNDSLFVSGESPGTAEITVEALLPTGEVIEDSFDVRVNTPPRIIGDGLLDALLLYLPGSDTSFTLNNYFEDDDGDELTYTVSNSDPTVVRTDTSDGSLQLSPQKIGVAEITVTASDGREETSDIISIEVKPNLPPVIVDSIPDYTVGLNSPELKNDLKRVFADPTPGDVLEFIDPISSNTSVASVEVDGDTLRVQPKDNPGTATIKITATDGYGSVTDSFEVTVSPDPVCRVANQIPDSDLPPDLAIDLTNVFDCENGTYAASSSVPEVADVRIENDTLIVIGESSGQAEISVLAENEYESVSLSFAVTVSSSCEVVEAIDDHTVLPDSLLSFDLLTVFACENATYEAFSSDMTIAIAEIDNDTLRIKSIRPDSVEITVSAENGSGVASHDFKVIVENNAPVVNTDFGEPLTDTTEVDFGTQRFLVNDLFIDRDGHALKFTSVSSLNPAFARVWLSQDSSTVTFDIFAPGSGSIEVEVTDSYDSTSVSLKYRTRLSQFSTVREAASEQHPLPVASTFRTIEVNSAKEIVLYYRKGGSDFVQGVMDSLQTVDDSTTFGFSIPPEFITEEGIEFFAEAVYATTSNKGDRQSANIQLNDARLPTAIPAEKHRLISFPLEIDGKRADSVFVDNLGGFNITRWRLFEAIQTEEGSCEPNDKDFNDWIEDQDTLRVEPGKAYWMISRNDIATNTINTGPGLTNQIHKPFAIELHRGWNLIGNPFAFAIHQSKIHHDPPLDWPDGRLFAHDGNGWIPTDIADWIEPYEGYAICSPEGGTLSIDPSYYDPSAATSTQPLTTATWAINISAKSRQARDTQNIASVMKEASLEMDLMDSIEPPWWHEFVSVYFPHPEWRNSSSRYQSDVRPEPAEGEVWDFEVVANTRDLVSLAFEGIDGVPEHFEVWLIDPLTQTLHDLRTSPSYVVAGASVASPRAFQLVVGNADFQLKKRAELDILPENTELLPNFPNPFNPSTTIPFNLDEPQPVTLEIYNALGRRVALLVRGEEKAAGRHVALWNGRNDAGQSVASGLYFIRFQAGQQVQTRKTMLVR